MQAPSDERARMIVLEYLVKHLIVQDCLTTEAPEARLEYWLGLIKEGGAIYEQLALGKAPPLSAEGRLNALRISDMFEEFHKEISERFSEKVNPDPSAVIPLRKGDGPFRPGSTTSGGTGGSEANR